MKFRIFTNDRGKQRGVFMYSGFKDFSAATASEAEATCEKKHGPFAYRGAHGPIKAIEWPATTPESKEWFAKHVGD